MNININSITTDSYSNAKHTSTNSNDKSNSTSNVNTSNLNINNINPQKLLTSFKAYNLPVGSSSAVMSSGNITKLNMNNIDMYDLPNNIRFIADTSPEIKKTEISFELKPNKYISAKPEAIDVLASMLCTAGQMNNMIDTYGYTVFTRMHGKTIKVEASPPGISKLNQSIDLLKKFTFNVEITEEKLAQEKQFLKKQYQSYLNIPLCLIETELSGRSIDEKLKSIESITLQDVKNLYSQILANSEGKVVVTMPKQDYKVIKSSIIDTLSSAFPMLQKSNDKPDPNLTSNVPLTHTKVFLKANNNGEPVKIDQSFKLIQNGNVKDIVATTLLNIIFGELEDSRLNKVLKLSNDKAYSECYEYTENKHIHIHVATESKQLKTSVDKIRSTINDLIAKPVSNEEFQKTKDKLKCNLTKDLANISEKNLFLSLDTPYSINYINEYIDAIDKITPKDLQNAARLFLTQPSLISIKADKQTLESNKNYLASLGEVNDMK